MRGRSIQRDEGGEMREGGREADRVAASGRSSSPSASAAERSARDSRSLPSRS